ncbi:RagB/SusD family nutrient uptake outer membrane protein [Niabella sp.]|uniref:RagB/SusD family nutrient uptake outer membrane protein n=1 Tax=Niabella sp. TaxID=1962976 RepID=UPI0026240CE0|nr:RagB/SusD family nutrient uptake outer membrane protein [Niabella sp.]
MNKFKLYITIAAVSVLASCSKSFLDTKDVTTGSEENFYKTPADAFKALTGVYAGLKTAVSNGGGIVSMSEVMSDNAFGATGNGDGWGWTMVDEFNKLRSPADMDMYSGPWADYYKAIYRANMLLKNIGQVNWSGTADASNAYIAETRFIRAYCYFDLVRLFGNIPLLTAPSADNIPQAGADSVYNLIAQDLKYAIDNLSAISYPSQDKATYGRATKWAAEALMARVYLYYTGYYGKPDLAGVITKADALKYTEDVIANSGHGLVDNFANLWPAASLDNYAGENNKETVFGVKYTFTGDYNGNTDGNQWMVMFGIRYGVNSQITPYGQGWGGATVNPRLWNAYSLVDSVRQKATIISIAGEELPKGGSVSDIQKDQREYTGYYWKKYTPMSDAAGKSLAEKLGSPSFQIGQYQDYVAIRYADVLLMAAELGSANAQADFDAVRKRALGAGFVQTPVSQAGIMAERRLEFAGEGIRYWDLLRQGVDAAASTIAETTTLLNGGAPATVTIAADNIKATKGLSQIPNNQISLSNGVLKQNAGW